MVAHTGFLIFARPMLPNQVPPRPGPPLGRGAAAASVEPDFVEADLPTDGIDFPDADFPDLAGDVA
jgi:hypothetical protein